VRLVVEGEDAAAVDRTARGLADDLRSAAPAVGLLGPAPLHRLRGRTRRALLARAGRAADAAGPLAAALGHRMAELRRDGVRAVVDVDPQET
jgi:primosomal protein N'